MGMPDDIATLLSDYGIVGGATGWSVFAGFRPSSPDKVVCLFEYPGTPVDPKSTFTKPGLVVSVRGESLSRSETAAADAEAKSAEIDALLHRYRGTIGGTRYLHAQRATSGAVTLYDDSDDRPDVRRSYELWKSED